MWITQQPSSMKEVCLRLVYFNFICRETDQNSSPDSVLKLSIYLTWNENCKYRLVTYTVTNKTTNWCTQMSRSRICNSHQPTFSHRLELSTFLWTTSLHFQSFIACTSLPFVRELTTSWPSVNSSIPSKWTRQILKDTPILWKGTRPQYSSTLYLYFQLLFPVLVRHVFFTINVCIQTDATTSQTILVSSLYIIDPRYCPLSFFDHFCYTLYLRNTNYLVDFNTNLSLYAKTIYHLTIALPLSQKYSKKTQNNSTTARML